MRVAFGSDHAGSSLKEFLKGELEQRGLHVSDMGTTDATAADKIPRIRAAAVHDVTTATLACRHRHQDRIEKLARLDRELVHNSEG